jgi:hypothetical protein
MIIGGQGSPPGHPAFDPLEMRIAGLSLGAGDRWHLAGVGDSCMARGDALAIGALRGLAPVEWLLEGRWETSRRFGILTPELTQTAEQELVVSNDTVLNK